MANAGLPRSVGHEFFESLPGGKPMIRDLMRASAAVFGHDPTEVMGRSRAKALFEARSAAMLLAVRKIGHPYNFVGYQLDRDHTTVMHASNVALNRVMSDAAYADAVKNVWALACEGRAAIAQKERERVERVRAELAAREIAKEKALLWRPNAARARANLPDVPSWTKNQLEAMNERFEQHMVAFKNGEGY